MWPFSSGDDTEADEKSYRDEVVEEVRKKRDAEGSDSLPADFLDGSKSFMGRVSDIMALRRGEFDSETSDNFDRDQSTGEQPSQNELAVDAVSPREFELVVAGIWDDLGWTTEVTSHSRDRGIDVVATKREPFEQKLLIQAKAHDKDNKIGSEAVRRYATLYEQVPDADNVVIVTTSYFTEQAKTLAEDLSVKLIDRDQLMELC